MVGVLENVPRSLFYVFPFRTRLPTPPKTPLFFIIYITPKEYLSLFLLKPYQYLMLAPTYGRGPLLSNQYSKCNK